MWLLLTDYQRACPAHGPPLSCGPDRVIASCANPGYGAHPAPPDFPSVAGAVPSLPQNAEETASPRKGWRYRQARSAAMDGQTHSHTVPMTDADGGRNPDQQETCGPFTTTNSHANPDPHGWIDHHHHAEKFTPPKPCHSDLSPGGAAEFPHRSSVFCVCRVMAVPVPKPCPIFPRP
ncbi:uncharacterized protein LOC129600900 [Paramacrobiotus metropolitanus]|uniref:uncharacterized protein LOC129600900 n=1 Tax=Paramacrobiotus metropolitanus TaxID=2943436 RepID=UPI0024458E80|nr:uncharacterized protein LOC129600900 [Paramacrobiotus metropolitanus]